MAKVIYHAVATTGEYTDREGNKKRRTMRCGVVLQSDKGMSLKLEAIPVGFDGWLNFYEPRQDEQGSGRQAAQTPAATPAPAAAPQQAALDDDIPF